MNNFAKLIDTIRSTQLIEAVNDLSLPEVRLIIDKADCAYYTPGLTSPITDEEYDAIRNRLKSLDPSDERLQRVGNPYSPEDLRNKVEHPIPMGSLDNTEDGIVGYDKWYNGVCSKLGRDDVDIFSSLKIDGGSIRARYEDGKLVVVATRGNGEVGEDITANGVNFHNLPLQLTEPITCDVRGEAILYVSDFRSIAERDCGKPFDEIPKNEISNPRNVGNGLLSRDDGRDSDKIRFITFNIVTQDRQYSTELEKMEHMKDLGFQPVPYKMCKTADDVRGFYEKIAAKRDALKYEIDGLVVVVNSVDHQNKFITDDIKTWLRPKHSRAIKFPHRSAVTKLKGVTITVGHSGAIIPTAILEEVRVGGVNVTHALLNNWDEINRLDVAIGDEVRVILAGDIIPKIEGCVNRPSDRCEIQEPSSCPSCGSNTTRSIRDKEGAVTYCTNPGNCPDALREKIDHWIGGSKKGVGILGIGDNMLKALWDQGIIKDPSDLYTLSVDDLKDVVLDGGVRIGRSRAQTVVDNIQEKRQLPLHVFLGSLGIELLGKRRVQVLQESANGELDSLDDWLDTDKLMSIQIEGLGDAIRNSIVSGIESNRDLIQRFLDKGVVVGSHSTGSDDSVGDGNGSNNLPFAGLTFCLTGTRECQGDIERLGGMLKSGVSKKLDYLVQKDPLSSSSKTKKAEQYGVKIISLDYLKKMKADNDVDTDSFSDDSLVDEIST